MTKADSAIGSTGRPSPASLKSAVELIAAERARQVNVEGWTAAHDDAHDRGEMALAAACYAWPSPRPLFVKQAWPWDRIWWKPAIPGNRVGFPEPHTDDEKRAAKLKDLVRAGALIVAEIERLQRESRCAPVSSETMNNG